MLFIHRASGSLSESGYWYKYCYKRGDGCTRAVERVMAGEG